MPSLQFRLKKRADSTAQLTLVRDDGSVSMGAVGPSGGYFPAHDLTHFAIEQILGLSEGFLGLVASGWEIRDFEVKGTAKRLSAETMFAECAAGELTRQILMSDPSSLEDFLWAVDIKLKQHSPDYARPSIDEAQLEAIRSRTAHELCRWRELPPNGTLDLVFTANEIANLTPPTVQERRAGHLAGCVQ